MSSAEPKDFTFEELSALSSPQNLHILIKGKVYAISKFLDEHPGGDEVLLGEAGKDATESFEDVGHSDEARSLMDQYCVGTCSEGSPKCSEIAKKTPQPTHSTDQPKAGAWSVIAPLFVLIAYLSYRFYIGS